MNCMGSNQHVAKTGGRKAVPPEERLALGERVKALRAELAAILGRDVPQPEIANRGGFLRTDMVAFEQGRKLSSHTNLVKLAVGFNIEGPTLSAYLEGKITAREALARQLAHDPTTVPDERYEVMPMFRMVARRDGYDEHLIKTFEARHHFEGQPSFTQVWTMFMGEVADAANKRIRSGDAGAGLDEVRVRPASKKR